MKHVMPAIQIKRIRPLLLFTFSLACIVVAWTRSYTQLHSWTYTHWRFDYSFNVYKRGLVGEILSLTDWDSGVSEILFLANANIALIFLFAAVMLSRPKIETHQLQGWIAFTTSVLICASTVQHLTLSLGRLNNVAFILALFAILAISKLGWVTSLIIATIISLLCIGIHEASLLLAIPLLLAAILYKYRFSRPFFILSACVAGASLLALAFITLKVPAIEKEAYLAYLKGMYKYIHRAAVWTRFTPLDENIKASAEFFWSMNTIIQHTIYWATTAPIYILLISGILKTEKNNPLADKWSTTLILILCHSPLLLYPLGIDHYRWLSACMINLSVILIIAYQHPGNTLIILDHFRKNWKIAYISVAIAILTGPTGVFFSYKWSEQFLCESKSSMVSNRSGTKNPAKETHFWCTD